MRFEIWQNNPTIMEQLNATFHPAFLDCCGCDAELQGDEVLHEFRNGQPDKFPVCLNCIDGAMVGEGQDCHADPVKMPALLERAEQRAVALLAEFNGTEGGAF